VSSEKNTHLYDRVTVAYRTTFIKPCLRHVTLRFGKQTSSCCHKTRKRKV